MPSTRSGEDAMKQLTLYHIPLSLTLIITLCLSCDDTMLHYENNGDYYVMRSCDDNFWGDDRSPSRTESFQDFDDDCVTYRSRLAWYHDDYQPYIQTRVCNQCGSKVLLARRTQELPRKSVRGTKHLYSMMPDVTVLADDNTAYTRNHGCVGLGEEHIPTPHWEQREPLIERKVSSVEQVLGKGQSLVSSFPLRPWLSVRYNDVAPADSPDTSYRCNSFEAQVCSDSKMPSCEDRVALAARYQGE